MTRRDLLVSTFATPMLAQESGKFEKLVSDYLQAFFAAKPEMATFLGEHRYDGRLANTTPDGVKADVAREQDFLRKARALETSRLDKVNQVDLRILIAHIESTIWSDTVLREREWNPMLYNPGSAIYYLLEREFAGLPQRLESVRGRLAAVPEYLAAARRHQDRDKDSCRDRGRANAGHDQPDHYRSRYVSGKSTCPEPHRNRTGAN